jgi:RimJ/RimL family protein N-acetyltransferase
MAQFAPFQARLRDGRHVTVRHAHPDDAEAFLELLRRIAGESETLGSSPQDVDYTLEEERDLLAKWAACPDTLVLVAEHDGHLLGDCSYRPTPQAKMRHHGLLGMMVDAPWRDAGLGRLMLTTLLDWCARHQRIECVRLAVYANNARALRLYDSLGFRKEGVRHLFFLHTDGRRYDDVMMALWVKPGLAPPGFCTWREARHAPNA